MHVALDVVGPHDPSVAPDGGSLEIGVGHIRTIRRLPDVPRRAIDTRLVPRDPLAVEEDVSRRAAEKLVEGVLEIGDDVEQRRSEHDLEPRWNLALQQRSNTKGPRPACAATPQSMTAGDASQPS